MNEGVGVDNADFVLYVSAIETKTCGGNTVAHAGHCMQDPITDRHICTYFQMVVFLINFSLFSRARLLCIYETIGSYSWPMTS